MVTVNRKWIILLLLLIFGFQAGLVLYQFQRAESRSAPFSVEVRPAHIRDSIPGQRCVFLVTATDEGEGRGKGENVTFLVVASGAETTVDPPHIAPGQVAEITVIPTESHVGKNLTVMITGKRVRKERQTASLWVNEGEDDLKEQAVGIRDMFIPWLAANQPELNITDDTKWEGTIVTPRILVVMHYLFFSDDWEMHVSWHVTIEPHNWARIDLRRRFREMAPSLAFEIPMLTRPGEAHPIEAPAFAWR